MNELLDIQNKLKERSDESKGFECSILIHTIIEGKNSIVVTHANGDTEELKEMIIRSLEVISQEKRSFIIEAVLEYLSDSPTVEDIEIEESYEGKKHIIE